MKENISNNEHAHSLPGDYFPNFQQLLNSEKELILNFHKWEYELEELVGELYRLKRGMWLK